MILLPQYRSTSGFADLSAETYHRWRLESQFLSRIERPRILPFLRAGGRVLDLGAGSGVWTAEIVKQQAVTDVVGIDDSTEMVDYARLYCPDAAFEAADARLYRDARGQGSFDLIIGGMSCDYIGFAAVARVVQYNLHPRGRAVLWFLDPTRYRLSNGFRIKQWQVDDQIISIRVGNFSLFSVARELRKARLAVRATSTVFSLDDGIERMLHVVECIHQRKFQSNVV